MALPTKKLKKCDKHVKHSKNKTCFAMWMTRWKTFSTYSHKRGSHSNVEPYACEEEEEESKKSNNEKFPAEESQPNALQWSSTLQQSNAKQLSISCPDQRSQRKCNCQSFLQCIH